MSPPRLILVAFALVHLAAPAAAQDRYLDPPPAIAAILDAPLPPAVVLSPDRQWLVLLGRPSLPTIAEVAAPDLRLAGVRLDPATNGPSRGLSFTSMVLRHVSGSAERRVATPAGARLGGAFWSPDGARFAFTVTGDRGIALWVAEATTGQARELVGPRLNGATGAPCSWSGANELLCRLIPEGRGTAPERPLVPAGPIVQESEGREAPNRTYQDLLQSPHDEALFDHYFTSQLALVTLDGRLTSLGRPGIVADASPSPDGQWIQVDVVDRPYSYLVPMSRFPLRMEVWDRTGKLVRTGGRAFPAGGGRGDVWLRDGGPAQSVVARRPAGNAGLDGGTGRWGSPAPG
jgi:dipeptidyl aminopeptidase/acylaminoacyl peptidase